MAYTESALITPNYHTSLIWFLDYQCTRGHKTFSVLNSVEHEILNAHKYKNIKKFGFFRPR